MRSFLTRQRFVALLGFIFATIGLSMFAAAMAQTVPDPVANATLTPDAVGILTAMGLGKYAAGIASLVALVGFVIVHIMPWLPVPKQPASGPYAALYTGLNWIAGNYGKALNSGLVQAKAAAQSTAAKTVALILAVGLSLGSLVACQVPPATIAAYLQTAANASQAVIAVLPAGTVVPVEIATGLQTVQSLATQLEGAGANATVAQELIAAEGTLLHDATPWLQSLGQGGQDAAIALAALNAVTPIIAAQFGVPVTAAATLMAPRLPEMTADEAVRRYGRP